MKLGINSQDLQAFMGPCLLGKDRHIHLVWQHFNPLNPDRWKTVQVHRGGASIQLPKRNIKSIYFKIPTQQLVLGNFKLNLLVIGVIMGSHETFQFFNNLIPLPFVIEFKICKVGRMHSYEYGGVLKTKTKNKGWANIWTWDERENEWSKLYVHTCK